MLSTTIEYITKLVPLFLLIDIYYRFTGVAYYYHFKGGNRKTRHLLEDIILLQQSTFIFALEAIAR